MFVIDLQAKNMLLEIDDPDVFAVFEEAEIEQPAPRRIHDDRIIYKSRRIPRTRRLPIITDFGEARFADEDHKGQDVMPDVYRAPEVIFRMNWDNKIDIWSIAMVVSVILLRINLVGLECKVLTLISLFSPGT